MSQTGIVIVTFNSEAEIGGCLDACLGAGATVVVVDNASADRIREVVAGRPGVRLIANGRNAGFAAAVNQGIAALDCPCVLLLNPDAVLLGGLGALEEACRRPGAAAAGGKLVDAGGRPQTGFMVRRLPTPLALILEVLGVNRLWPGNPVNRRYRCLDLDPEREAEVEQPAGAFLMVNREAWERVGGFDESYYPLWFEEVDFARRAHDMGYRIYYVPAAAAEHRGGHSVKRLPWESREQHWYGSLLRYASRHFGRASSTAVSAAVMLGCALRAVLGIFSRRSAQPLFVYAKVMRRAARYLLSGRGDGGCRASALARQP